MQCLFWESLVVDDHSWSSLEQNRWKSRQLSSAIENYPDWHPCHFHRTMINLQHLFCSAYHSFSLSTWYFQSIFTCFLVSGTTGQITVCMGVTVKEPKQTASLFCMEIEASTMMTSSLHSRQYMKWYVMWVFCFWHRWFFFISKYKAVREPYAEHLTDCLFQDSRLRISVLYVDTTFTE